LLSFSAPMLPSHFTAKMQLTSEDKLENRKERFLNELMCLPKSPLQKAFSTPRTPQIDDKLYPHAKRKQKVNTPREESNQERCDAITETVESSPLASADLGSSVVNCGSSATCEDRQSSIYEEDKPSKNCSGSVLSRCDSLVPERSSKSPITSSIRIRTKCDESSASLGRLDWMKYLTRLVKSDRFEVCFAILIVSSAVVMCVEAHYWGFDSGHALGFPNMSQPGSVVWPGADIILKILDWFFGIAFALEVLIKCMALRISFVKSWWNIFDSIIAASWVLNTLLVGVVPGTLGVARLARLIRLLRLVKTFTMFDSLQLMVATLSASMSVLLWSIAFLLGIMVSSALLMTSVMSVYISDKGNPGNERMEAFEYFGNFSRALLSIFELTLGNWAPIARFLHEHVSEWFGVVIIAYQLIVGFAVVMVIRGVFLHETFQAVEHDDDLMILRQIRRKAKLTKKMEALFLEADDSGDGYLNHEEFVGVMKDDRVKAWLSAMGLEVSEADIVFEMVDDGNHKISVDQFVDGLARLKGAARGVDMVQVLRLVRNLEPMVQDIGVEVGCKRKRDSLRPTACNRVDSCSSA